MAEFSAQRVLVTIRDIGPTTRVDNLAIVLAGLTDRGLPISLVLQTRSEGGDRMQPDDAIALLLRTALQKNPGLIELVPYVADLHLMRPFQQSRAAGIARAELVAGLGLSPVQHWPGEQLRTLACDAYDDTNSPGGIRAAGMRSLLSLPIESEIVIARVSASGVLDLSGGVPTRLEQAGAVLLHPSQNDEPREEELQKNIILSAKSFDEKSVPQLRAETARFSNAAANSEIGNRLVLFQAADLMMRIDLQFRRMVSVHVFDADPENPQDAIAIESLRSELERIAIPFSTGKRLASLQPDNGDDGYWIPAVAEQNSADEQPVVTVLQHASLSLQGPLRKRRWETAADRRAGISLRFVDGGGPTVGFDQWGQLHVPVALEISEATRTTDILAALGTLGDGLIGISAGGVNTPLGRSVVLDALGKLQADQATDLVTLPNYVARLLPEDELLLSFMRTEAIYAPAIAPRLRTNDSERVALMQDAQSAWQFIARVTDNRTGLCRSTANFAPGAGSDNPSTTMWDVGSHLKGILAASDLGLVDDDECTARYTTALRTVDRAIRSDVGLPAEEINTETGRGTRGFNGYDTCRLLSAMHDIADHRLGQAWVSNMVAGWDFSKVLIERQMHSILRGSLVSDYASNYMHYAALSLRAWGYDVASPHDGMQDINSADDKMGLLYHVAALGPIGAEPTLLELMDFGEIPQASYLADVLFAAQIEEYQMTGRLLFPSESPIDHLPWFLYQGYRVNAVEDPWTVESTRNDPEYRTDEFISKNLAASPKAAYLWAALRPHPHSSVMQRLARDIGRMPTGFASAIYVGSGAATRDYSDINTNGVILQAIARQFRDN